MRGALSTVLSKRAPRWAAVGTAAAYLVLYLYLIGDLAYSPALITDAAPSVRVAPDWPSLLFRERVSFGFEPIAAVYFTEELALLVSPVNVALGAVLAVLIGLNVAFLAFALAQPQACGRPSAAGAVSSLPTLLMGFTCCVPTVLIALGSAAASFTLGFIAVRTVFFPAAAAGLLFSIWLNTKRMVPRTTNTA